MKRTLGNTPDTDDQLIKLSLYGPLRTGSMNTQVRAVHGQTASLCSRETVFVLWSRSLT